MNFEHLKIYTAVVENGGFTRAAEVLNMSHSTASRAVSALEDALGVRLLDRNSRGFKITEAGSLLYEQGSELLRRIKELEEQVAAASGDPEYSLKVAVAPMSCKALDAAFERYSGRYPGGFPVIFRRSLSEVKSMVARGRADLGVSFSYALGDMEGFESLVLDKSGFCAVAREGSPLKFHQPLTVEQLRGENYITAGERRSGFTAELEEPVLEDRPASEICAAATLESLFMMIRGGKGITLAPRPLAEEYGEGCELLELDFDTEFDIVLFWAGEEAPAGAAKFVKTAIEE